MKLWDSAMHVLSTMPLWLASFLIGWSFSAGITQGMKFTMPEAFPPRWREAVARWVAFLTAACPAGAWMVEGGASGLAVALVALGTGAWSPIAYALLIAGLRRWERTAWVADVLSQDVRGVVLRKRS